MAASTPPRKRAPRKAAPAITHPPAYSEAKLVTAPSSAAEFKRKAAGELLELPSGLYVRMTRPGMQEFVKAGFLPSMLQPTIDAAIKRGQGLKPTEQKALLEKARDPAMMDQMLRTYALICERVWQEPKILSEYREVVHANQSSTWETIPASERDPDALYTDEVDFNDKAFTFNFAVGGTRDLQRFRQEFASGVESLHGSEDVAVQA